jgi:Flp pilus assembly protein TadG
MSAMSVRRLPRGERGAVLVEFALALPVLLVLIAGTADLGFALHKYQAVTNAAREGARMAVLPGYSAADVQGRVTDYLTASGVRDPSTATVRLTSLTPPSGAAFTTMSVEVRVTHTFSFLGPLARLVRASFGTVTLTSTAVMRAEVAASGS